MYWEQYFRGGGDYAEFCPDESARYSVATLINDIVDVVAFAAEHGIHQLLIDITALSDLPSPSLGERFMLAQGVALVAKGRVQIATVAPLRLHDPQRFGVQVAKNRGVNVGLFQCAGEARKWLAQSPTLAPSPEVLVGTLESVP